MRQDGRGLGERQENENLPAMGMDPYIESTDPTSVGTQQGSRMPELKGLARSFDALFAAIEAAPAEDAPEPESPLGVDEYQAAGVITEPDARVDHSAPIVSEDPADLGEPVFDAWDDIGAAEHDDVLSVLATDALVREEPVFDGLDDVGSDSESSGSADAGSEDEEFVPTPLDRATAEFIAGDASRAHEIESLAAECVEQRDLDPVARAVAALTLAAGDPVDTEIYSVAESITSPSVLDRLARQISLERDEGKRAEYFTICRTIGANMASAIRADLAESTDRLARKIYCQALVEMGEAGRAVIEDMAVDENRFLVRNAISILGEQGGERAVELCTSALANPDARVRKEALRSLAKLGDLESGPIVVGLLDDPDVDVRLAAIVAAGELRVERALKPLIATLKGTKNPDEALTLIRALGRIADPGAVASIEKHAVTSLFSRPRTDVRITAYRALNEIGTPRARRLLNQALNDKDPAVKAAVKAMLGMR